MYPLSFGNLETVTDEQKYELCEKAVTQTGDALKHVPAEFGKSETVTDEQKYELYEKAVTQTEML